jgi:ABC-type transport system involved in multi-copper enzyme maturation permease subunit
MGRSVLRVSTKVKTLKIYTVRAALIFLALILAFGLVEPGASTALAESAHTKSFDTNYKLDPLKSTAQQKQTELTQQSGSMLSRSTTSFVFARGITLTFYSPHNLEVYDR